MKRFLLIISFVIAHDSYCMGEKNSFFNAMMLRIKENLNLDKPIELYKWKAPPLIHLAANNKNWYFTHVLLEWGADPNVRSPGSKRSPDTGTALHYAVQESALKTTQTLLSHNADPNEIDAERNTPLHHICSRHQDTFDNDECINTRIAIAQALLSHGADPDRQNRLGETPLFDLMRFYCLYHHYCPSHKERALTGYARYDQMFLRQRKALISLLIRARVNFSIRNNQGLTALQATQGPQDNDYPTDGRPWEELSQELIHFTLEETGVASYFNE